MLKITKENSQYLLLIVSELYVDTKPGPSA